MLELIKLLLAEIWLWSGLYFGFYSLQALYYAAIRIKDSFKRPILQILIQLINALVSIGSIGIMTWRTIELGVFSLAPWFWIAYMAVEVIAASIELYNTVNDFEEERLNPAKKLELLQKLFDTKVNVVAMTLMALACLLMFTPMANIFVIAIFSAIVVAVFLIKYFYRPRELPPDLTIDLAPTPAVSRLNSTQELFTPSYHKVYGQEALMQFSQELSFLPEDSDRVQKVPLELVPLYKSPSQQGSFFTLSPVQSQSDENLAGPESQSCRVH